ncbi:lytic transglycosylase domain-containing protein [Streptomyces sp. NPDC006012]|uniref:lytic transglycosylase domain-containing protein n=1 Tax=Streptomyces sp. NPDC006012 TaxID=3364739 RepID=UPI00367D5D4E
MSTEQQKSPIALIVSALTALGGGCLGLLAIVIATPVVLIFCGLGVLLAPIVALILLFGGGGGSHHDYDDMGDQAITAFNGDGKGALAADSVPKDLQDTIEEAGGQCTQIGPIVIASQLEYASGFNSAMVGAHGEKGISQLPTAIFDKYGKDDDDNDKTSALDNEDSIMAQARYMCALANENQKRIDNKTATGNVLDLTLAAYHLGMDASSVGAGGVTLTGDTQGYVAAIRAQFAKYGGIVDLPYGATPSVSAGESFDPRATIPPPPSPSPSDSPSPSP